MNGATHYLDLSHLYGNSPEKLSALRSGILLNTFNDYGRELPPLTQRKECMSAKDGAACFESGRLWIWHTVEDIWRKVVVGIWRTRLKWKVLQIVCKNSHALRTYRFIVIMSEHSIAYLFKTALKIPLTSLFTSPIN